MLENFLRQVRQTSSPFLLFSSWSSARLCLVLAHCLLQTFTFTSGSGSGSSPSSLAESLFSESPRQESEDSNFLLSFSFSSCLDSLGPPGFTRDNFRFLRWNLGCRSLLVCWRRFSRYCFRGWGWSGSPIRSEVRWGQLGQLCQLGLNIEKMERAEGREIRAQRPPIPAGGRGGSANQSPATGL